MKFAKKKYNLTNIARNTAIYIYVYLSIYLSVNIVT